MRAFYSSSLPQEKNIKREAILQVRRLKIPTRLWFPNKTREIEQRRIKHIENSIRVRIIRRIEIREESPTITIKKHKHPNLDPIIVDNTPEDKECKGNKCK